MTKLKEDMVVRDKKWNSGNTGTVVRLDHNSVFVAWHGTCVEEELDFDDVEPYKDAPAELSGWRGGIGRISADSSFAVEPL